MAKENIPYLELEEALYDSISLKEALEKHTSALREHNRDRDIYLANKIDEFIKLRADEELKENLSKLSSFLYKKIRERFPTLIFSVSGRIKNLVSAYNKFISTLDDGGSLDDVKDLVGIRFIIHNYGDENPITACYELSKFIIDTLSRDWHSTPSLGSNVKGTGKFDSKQYPNISLPTDDDRNILNGNSLYIKDYITEPKNNGYQSLHFVMWLSKISSHIEFQIRTIDMHIRAESRNYASHDLYKEESKPTNSLIFDPYRVTVLGYNIIDDGKLLDDIDLQDSSTFGFRSNLN